MTQICGKWLKYMGKWLKYVGKCLNYLTNGLKMWKMTQRFGKWPKYLGNDLDTCDPSLVFEKRFYNVENGLRI